MRYRFLIAYDGTDFHGWAKQPGLDTVQGVLEDALSRILRLGQHQYEPSETAHPYPELLLTVAGRTDVGVHASAQVFHIDVDEGTRERFIKGFVPREPNIEDPFAYKLLLKLNQIFSRDGKISIRDIRATSDDFDARFSALSRTYEYRIADDEAFKNPLHSRYTLWHFGRLELEMLNEAAQVLVGLHDFATFCKPRPGSTTIRFLQEFSWTRDQDGVLLAHIRADAFCHNMIRALVGACVAVAENRLTVEELGVLMENEERTSRFKVFPAHGLTMVGVEYPEPSEYASRDQQTRAKRT